MITIFAVLGLQSLGTCVLELRSCARLPTPSSIRPPDFARSSRRTPLRSSPPRSISPTPSTRTLTGLPRAHVRLVGLDLALDARGAGGEVCWVRNGCRLNAVLRPVLCEKNSKRGTRGDGEDERLGENGAGKDDDEDAETLSFAVFALRDLKAHEEVVLGWEWDDGCAVHHLPALLERPWTFPPSSLGSPATLAHLRAQLATIAHTLASTFTTCACGEAAEDSVLRRMERIAEELEELEEGEGP